MNAADTFIQHNKDRHKKHICATKDFKGDINIVSIERDKQYNYLKTIAENPNRKHPLNLDLLDFES